LASLSIPASDTGSGAATMVSTPRLLANSNSLRRAVSSEPMVATWYAGHFIGREIVIQVFRNRGAHLLRAEALNVRQAHRICLDRRLQKCELPEGGRSGAHAPAEEVRDRRADVPGTPRPYGFGGRTAAL